MRYEGSNPSLCTIDSRDAFSNIDGRVCRVGSVGVDDAERSEVQAINIGDFGHVRI